MCPSVGPPSVYLSLLLKWEKYNVLLCIYRSLCGTFCTELKNGTVFITSFVLMCGGQLVFSVSGHIDINTVIITGFAVRVAIVETHPKINLFVLFVDLNIAVI